MKETLRLLEAGFESSSGKTPEFKHFTKVFKKEFSRELQSIGATDIVFSVGHFYISGFFTVNAQPYYFSVPVLPIKFKVRGMNHLKTHPDSSTCKLLYRTAKDYKDYTGGVNRYVRIKLGMSADMCWYFKIV